VKAGVQNRKLNPAGAQKDDYVGKILFRATFDFAERHAVKVEVKHIDLIIPADKRRPFPVSSWQRNEIGRRGFFDIQG
jgi:hypothetical protein